HRFASVLSIPKFVPSVPQMLTNFGIGTLVLRRCHRLEKTARPTLICARPPWRNGGAGVEERTVRATPAARYGAVDMAGGGAGGAARGRDPAGRRRGAWRGAASRFALALACVGVGAAPAHAVDGMWLAAPATADFNTGTNWTSSPSVPNGTASFGASTKTSLT